MATDTSEIKHGMLLEVTETKGPDRRRQGKFQPFRRLFGKKKKREAKGCFDGAELKASYSTGEVCNGVVSEDEESNQNLRELNPIGSRALSHDSIFIPEEPVKEPGLDHSMSQENVSDKVRNLQKQIAQGMKFGQRPSSLRKSEGDEGSSDEEEVPRSPLKVLAQVEAEPPKTEPKVQGAHTSGQHSTPVKSPRSKRVLSPTGTIESINLDAVPQSVLRLDNTAAKHKLSVKPKNQRVSRKHRRFTLDLQEVSLQDDLEAAGVTSNEQRRASVEESRESLKKQRLYEVEIQEARRRRELEEQRLREEEEERKKKAEELRLEEERCRRKQQEEEERRMREEAQRRRREEEERIIREEEERRRREEADRRRREEEERRIREDEERRRREEADRRRREEEERRIREEEERRRQEEAERRKREEERAIREEEEKRRREKEERMRKMEEERKIREEEERRQREEEERRRWEEQRKEEERRKQEEEVRRQQELEAETKRKQKEEEEKRKKNEEIEQKQKKAEERMRKEEERRKMYLEENNGGFEEQERKRRAEELRWKEMEERQRPFSFKVSSGEKQILFQKVNLTPVTPTSSHQIAAAADPREGVKASSSEGPDSPNLPASPYVPHTAILVTGAQLCGTAVNMDQIKDTACKSLLGLGEDRKAQGTPQAKSKTSPDRKSGKTKSLNESVLTTDQSSAAVLAEWASIRSKIFKGVEDGKYDDYQDPANRNPPQPSSEEQAPFAHTNLRKTMSASAKFSITTAKKKFGDSNRNSEVFGPDDKEAGEEAAPSESPTAASTAPSSKLQNRTSKTVRIVERGSDECMFAKDLPSFLVPSPGDGHDKPELKSRLQSETETSESKEEGEERGQDNDDKPSPFGIKLRRTNYSLRFHSEQSTEKRKKRYSAGDSFDGVPSPLTPIEPDSDASSVFSDRSSPTSPQKEGVVSKYLLASASPAIHRGKLGKSTSPTAHHESDKVLSKPPLYKRPTTSPKPSGVVPTPPPSPLPKVVPGTPCDDIGQRTGSPDSFSQEQTSRSEEPSVVAQLHRSSHGQVQGEEEPKEKRSFFPSLNMPWREKTDRKTEVIRKEKPSLQSRHSLDSAKVQEKEAGPLWITLALQKQKGFREQQQNRDERRSQREAKLSEKQAREIDCVTLVSPTESKGSGSTSPSSKPQPPEEPKRPDSLLGRIERREHLKKANTLPSSVTVEIADSTPSPPAAKDVSKRFPSSDSPQVCTEPAWLALAKRKAKAWSDCPQIIK